MIGSACVNLQSRDITSRLTQYPTVLTLTQYCSDNYFFFVVKIDHTAASMLEKCSTT